MLIILCLQITVKKIKNMKKKVSHKNFNRDKAIISERMSALTE